MGAQRAVSLPRLPVPCLAQLSHSVPAQPSRAGRVAAALRGLFSSAQVCLEEEECDQGNMLYTGQEAGPVVMNSFLSLSVASVFYSFSPNSSFFIVCFRTALKFPVLSRDRVMCCLTLLWRLLLLLHFSPGTCCLPARAVCSETCREQPSLSPFPNVTIQGFPVCTPEQNAVHFSQKQAVRVGVKPGRPHLQPSPAHLTEQGSTACRAGVTL